MSSNKSKLNRGLLHITSQLNFLNPYITDTDQREVYLVGDVNKTPIAIAYLVAATDYLKKGDCYMMWKYHVTNYGLEVGVTHSDTLFITVKNLMRHIDKTIGELRLSALNNKNCVFSAGNLLPYSPEYLKQFGKDLKYLAHLGDCIVNYVARGIGWEVFRVEGYHPPDFTSTKLLRNDNLKTHPEVTSGTHFETIIGHFCVEYGLEAGRQKAVEMLKQTAAYQRLNRAVDNIT